MTTTSADQILSNPVKNAGLKVPTKTIPVAKTSAGNNDRTVFDPSALRELADSIESHGLIQPITVRPKGDGYEIVAGERRFRAISLLQWTHFPAVVKEMDDAEAAAVMLAENTSRANLDPIDEAKAYHRRMEEFGWTSDEIGRKAGVSGSRVRARLKLLKLEDTVQKLTRSGQFPLSYAQLLVDADLPVDGQLSAMRIFNNQERPTLQWFQTVVSELISRKQTTMFDDYELELQIQAAAAQSGDKPDPKKLPRPGKQHPPRPQAEGEHIVETIERNRDFWRKGQEGWAGLNSTWYAYECQIAADALDAVLATLTPQG